MPQTREEKRAKDRAFAKHRRDWLRDHGLCVWCGKAEAEPGKVLCIDCEIKNAEFHARAYERKSPEEKRAYCDRKRDELAARRKMWKETGRCYYCGKKLPADHAGIACLECRIKRKRYRDARRERNGQISWEQRTSGYYCFRCCKPIEPGERNLCPECYEKTAASAYQLHNSRGFRENIKLQHKLNEMAFMPRG